MSFLIPLIPSLVSAGAGLFGAHKQRKAERRAERRGPNISRISQFDPGQQQVADLINSIITGQGQQPTGGLLGELFGDEGFKAYSDPAIKAYKEQIVPYLAEQFTGGFGPGVSGAQSSSAFQNALSRSGEELAMGLGQLRSQQRQSSLSGLLNQYLTPRQNIIASERGGSAWGQGLGAFGAGGASTLTKLLTDLLQQKFGSKPANAMDNQSAFGEDF